MQKGRHPVRDYLRRYRRRICLRLICVSLASVEHAPQAVDARFSDCKDN